MDKEDTYNGWTNYETWAVNLWLENDKRTWEYWWDEARRHWAEAPECEQVKAGTWTIEQAARFNFVDQLKDELEEGSPITEASLYSDLLNAALSKVNWYEVAEAFLDGIEMGDPENPADEEGVPDGPEKSLRPKFSLGRVVSTPGALGVLSAEDIRKALGRHHSGDWGDVGPEDWQENNLSLQEGFRLLSCYKSESGEKFWIITEADRSVTTILLPSEY